MRIRRILGWTALAIPMAIVLLVAIAHWTATNACDLPAAPLRDAMKAVTYCDYGPPGTLRVTAVEKPVPEPDEVLVRVHAAAANPYDWHFIRGTPYLMRLESGLGKPKSIRVGVDFAGTIEAVGSEVTRFEPGDAVFGGRGGAFAEYLTIREAGSIAHKPPRLTFEQAAGLYIAGLTALQALHRAGVEPGTDLLINGASGGVGTLMVQIARSMGARVTGVCSTRNLALVRSLGADDVIDYTREDYTRGGRRFDAIVDNVGNHGFLANRRALAADGVYVLIGGGGPGDGRWIGPLASFVKGPLLRPFVKQDMGMFISSWSPEDLATLAGLVKDGSLKAVVDRTYALEEVVAAMRYLETGRARGKVVLRVDAGNAS